MVLARFAPFPTGPLRRDDYKVPFVGHPGGRRNQGKWILRIEDTDQVRIPLFYANFMCNAVLSL